jgi:hypothetical protein
MFERAEAFATALARDLEGCAIAIAVAGAKRTLDFVAEMRPESHAIGT